MIIPTLWNGLNAGTRRMLEAQARSAGNRVVWLRLFDRGNGLVMLDMVKISGRTATSGQGLLSLCPDMRLELTSLSRWIVSNLGIPMDSENFAETPNSYGQRTLVPYSLGGNTIAIQRREQQLAAESTVTEAIKKLINIDITGFAAESRDSTTSDDHVTP